MSKIANINYERLELQQYLSENKNTKISKLIAKARAKTLEIKTHKSWKYEDKLYSGCEIREESVDDILSCKKFEIYEEVEKMPKYEWLFGDDLRQMLYCEEVLKERLNIRQSIYENG